MNQSQKPDSILEKPGRTIRSRSLFMFICCLMVACVLVGRLIYLQIIKYEDYRRLVIEQMVQETSISASRGAITDRNGVVIATNYTTERIFIDPSAMVDEEGNFSEEIRVTVAQGLSEILGVEYDFVYGETLKTKYKDRTIKKNVEKATANEVRAFMLEHDIKCIHFAETATRVYPFSTLASHVIGFCGTDGGLYGLEYQYDSVLKGQSGKIVSAEDPYGNAMSYDYEMYIDASNGANIKTTLDYKIQSILEKYLEEAAIESGCRSRAAGIIMDPNTGEVYGMATYPYYNLNDPYKLPSYYDALVASYAQQYGEDSEEYKKAVSALLITTWNNKCVTDTYEPGSTAKIITTSIAIEENLAKTTETFSCTGSYKVSGWTIKCHKTVGHGTLTFAGGLQQSCNPIMMKLSERIGISTYAEYFRAFGLTEKTGIDLPGEASPIYKEESELTMLDLAVYSFGQRFNVTTLELISAVACVANGGTLVTPHMVKEIVDDDGNVLATFGTNEVRQVISEKTAQTISEILAEGVATNGGAKNAYVKGYSVAAKTGTSEKGTTSARICSTIAYAPYYAPEVICLIIVDEPTIGSIYGSTVAAPYVSKILSEVLPYLGVEPQYTEEELASMDISVSNYRGMSLDQAKSLIGNAGLKYEVVGSGTSVVNQVPSSGSRMSKENGKIFLYTKETEENRDAIVPDVSGMTAEKANKALTDAGLNVHLEGATIGGEAIVHSQSIVPGTVVAKGTIVKIEMRYVGIYGD
ncbi:MAG: PASTA domain-containing protein [Clostridia bacterium]|nr:PASTA domain-containing protein [Clostridia bacterium]